MGVAIVGDKDKLFLLTLLPHFEVRRFVGQTQILESRSREVQREPELPPWFFLEQDIQQPKVSSDVIVGNDARHPCPPGAWPQAALFARLPSLSARPRASLEPPADCRVHSSPL